MKLSMMLNYAGGFHAAVDRVVELEKAGLDVVWIAEAYSADAISQVGYLAAKTNRVEIGTGIVNVYSRTAITLSRQLCFYWLTLSINTIITLQNCFGR